MGLNIVIDGHVSSELERLRLGDAHAWGAKTGFSV